MLKQCEGFKILPSKDQDLISHTPSLKRACGSSQPYNVGGLSELGLGGAIEMLASHGGSPAGRKVQQRPPLDVSAFEARELRRRLS